MVNDKKCNSQEMKELIQTDQVLSMPDDDVKAQAIKRQKCAISSNDNQHQLDTKEHPKTLDLKNITTANQKTFLFCHFYMLRSLYCNSMNNSSLLQPNNDDHVPNDIWKLIEQFLMKQTELEDVRTNAKYLKDVYDESTHINFTSDSKIFSNKAKQTKNDQDDDKTTTPAKVKESSTNNLFFQNPHYCPKSRSMSDNGNTPCPSKKTNQGCWYFLSNVISKKSSISIQKSKDAFLPYLKLSSFVQMLCCKLRTKYHKVNMEMKKKFGFQ